ncbi:jg16919 [Pararge aegeria aegeria]|uniref:Jg16919 protein n=1 Tax=Pararge aegeria aegeria TaxID=348720 RepID=A0A8S4SH69_9NEOP|nr:jg16919 [Pararge aegeria aegeria]
MEDEQMLDLIRRANPNCGYMYVVDTRPKINAMVNRAAGKGYENEAFYENIKFQFMGIGNIHVMRKSLQKLVETCEQNSPTMSSFLSGLESSGWLKHIKYASCRYACNIECCCCTNFVLVTGMLVTVTLWLHQALIEKDWLSFGHKFTARCGHVACDSRERSPVFTQLLDCTWQLLRQAPEAFQFNERFLLTLHDHAHACQYGTFIGNCEKDRRDLRLLYESGGNVTELECANHDHPLKDVGSAHARTGKIPLITEKADAAIPATLAQLEAEINTVALDWKSIKNVTECSCSTPLDHFSRKHHCWGCGRCVCTRFGNARHLSYFFLPQPAVGQRQMLTFRSPGFYSDRSRNF